MSLPFFDWRDAPEGDFAVIGDPVDHSLSPLMHAAAYCALGLEWRYHAVRVARGEVAQALDELKNKGYRGANVTVPHKEEAIGWPKLLDPFSQRVGAVNTLDLSKGEGINTDGEGFLRTLAEWRLSSGRALVLGAGGSARSIVAALSDAGFSIGLHNRDRQKAVKLASSLGVNVDILDAPNPYGASLIVNATSAGLVGASPEVQWDRAERGALAYDLSYASNRTPFLESAHHAGLRLMDGKPLLAAQGALSFEYWLGIPAPREAMLKALR